jgi:hypothetical protein
MAPEVSGEAARRGGWMISYRAVCIRDTVARPRCALLALGTLKASVKTVDMNSKLHLRVRLPGGRV